MKEFILHYCDKCGAFQQAWTNNSNGLYCAVCGEGQIKPVPKEYTTLQIGTTIDKNKEQEFIEKYIKSSSNFDQYLFDHKNEIREEKNRPIRAALEANKVTYNQPKCPYCGSTNISKIITLNRAVSVGLLGLASS